MNNTYLIVSIIVAVLVALGVLIILRPQFIKNLGNRIGMAIGKVMERHFYNQFKKKFPELAEKFAEFGAPTQERQECLMNAFKRLPPMEARKLYTEFQRLQANFIQRHPEVESLINTAQTGDPKAQIKAIESLLKLPEDQRKSISKDFIWAWDQLKGRFPSMVGALENAYKKAS